MASSSAQVPGACLKMCIHHLPVDLLTEPNQVGSEQPAAATLAPVSADDEAVDLLAKLVHVFCNRAE